ncbi:MAG: PEP-CTERM sorting domain-containing protein [Thiohalocapsa sp. PB-PSB1]|jgi:hypothetical protein|nr:MAG: PEP-CTERM sorting domain-containing protein [Thiohalocapsa sp. PB-PSB1]
MMFAFSLDAGATVIDANSFTYVDPTGNNRAANDFTITIGGFFVGPPSSSVFPNNDFPYPGGKPSTRTNKVKFSGNDLASGSSHNVKFKSTGPNPNPRGQFTINNNPVGGIVKSKDLKGRPVAFIPSGSGFDVTFDLVNDFGAFLTGSVNVYVNTGLLDYFTLEDFDTLRNERLIFSEASYALNAGEGFFGLTTHLDSRDEYILVIGTANSGDGFGDFAFSNAFSDAPEPATINILLLGVAGLWCTIFWRRTTCYGRTFGQYKAFLQAEPVTTNEIIGDRPRFFSLNQ